MLSPNSNTGWVVFWGHLNGRDKCRGETWPDREAPKA